MRIVRECIKCMVFLAILGVSLLTINRWLEPKNTGANSAWPSTSTYHQFYQMDRDSLDVLFLGSSMVVNAFSPQALYNEYGIRSYNLGSEQQSVFLSYYWLKEALRFQSPSVVVMDTAFLTLQFPECVINMREGMVRKCLDPMKWSRVKAEAVRDLCARDTSQSALSYYLTNIRFHSRWKMLGETDVTKSEYTSAALKGFGVITEPGAEQYFPFYPSDPDAMAKLHPLMKEYMDKIVSLCGEHGCQLLLVRLPGPGIDDAMHNALTRYAEDAGTDFMNLAEAEYTDAIGVTPPLETIFGHTNIWGSVRIAAFFGKLLTEQYGVTPVRDEQFERTRADYEHTLHNASLLTASDFASYLRLINDPDYAVFIAAYHDDVTEMITDDVREALNALGLHEDFTGKRYISYIAAVSPDAPVTEMLNDSVCSHAGSIRNKNTFFQVSANSYLTGERASIVIDGTELTASLPGFNLVVYDLKNMRVTDAINYDGSTIRRPVSVY